MKRVSVTCTGIEAILMNPVTEEMLMHIRNKTTPQKRPGSEFPVEEEAGEKLMYGDAYGHPGRIVLPIENLYAALKTAGRKVKNGKYQVSTATTTTLFSFLKIEDKCVLFESTDGGDVTWETDLRRGTNPNGGQLVVLVRPKIRDWRFTVTVRIDDSVSETLVRELFAKAGVVSGLGDFRPSTGGPFGCFEVTNWVVLESTKTAKAKAGEGEKNGHADLGAAELAAAVS